MNRQIKMYQCATIDSYILNKDRRMNAMKNTFVLDFPVYISYLHILKYLKRWYRNLKPNFSI